MAGLLQNVIMNAEADTSTHTVRLAWQDGSTTIADFKPLVGCGVSDAFQDPAFFRQVRNVEDGHVLTWSGEREFDADVLWFEAHPEDSPAFTTASHAR